MKFIRSLLVFLAMAACAAVAPAQDAPLKQPGKWAQDYVGRAADPAVRFGTLPNGLRYAILKNDTPKEAVAMRMLIGSGSLKEREEERGLAHFLEHMAFRGSTNVPDGEVVHMLERLGLRFGPDTNAGTGHETTTYMFNFPRATPEALATGFKLFREIGERLTLDPAAVEVEKGVVLSEERVRDTPALKATKANIALLFQGTLVPDRLPIGTVETIRGATSERLRRYYRANYRPDNATIVVVGAVDPAAIEAQIKAGFADWKAAGPAEPFNAGIPKPAETAIEYVAEGAPDQLSINWVRSADRRAVTEALDRERLTRMLAIVALNNRLSDRALKPGNPFAAAGASQADSVLGVAALSSLAIQGDPAKWREGMLAAVEEQRVLLRDGLGEDDLKRARVGTLTRFQSAADAATTRRNESLADQLVSAASEGELFTSPAQDLAFASEALAKVTAQDVTAALRGVFVGSQPLIFRTARATPATPAALTAALASAQAAALPAPVVRQAATWPYGNFGAPGAVTTRREDAGLGATFVTFANGTRLAVKQTAQQKDQVQISIGFGAGQAGLPEALARAGWATSTFPVGGLGKLTVPELQQLMQSEGKLGSVQPAMTPRRFMLNGGTRPADLAFEMQLLAAFTVDPGFRPELGDRLRTIAPMLKAQIAGDPGTVFRRMTTDLLQGNDRRFAQTPSDADLDATQPADIEALVRPQLATAPDIAIVGDIAVEDAIRITAATFGAIARSPRPAEATPRITMPAGRAEPFVVSHGGRADQAVYGMAWPMPDYLTDPKLSHTADVAAALIASRLIDTVREKLGLTYSPSAAASASIDLAGLGYLIVQTETPPDKFDAMRAAVLEVIADLGRAPVSADMLERARQPLVEAARKAQERNDYWARGLGLVLREPRGRDVVIGQAEALAAVSAEQVHALFSRFVIAKTPITVIARARTP